MALTLVATPGAADANAYADAAAAVAAAAYRIGPNATAFLALSADQQIQALVTATRDIDSIVGTRSGDYTLYFLGTRSSEDQALEFPRSGTDWPVDELPAPLVQATIELAFSYAPAFAASYTADVLNNDTTAGRIKRKKLDVIETEYFEAGADGVSLSRLPAMVERLLSQLLDYVPITGAWGQGTTVRGS